jgi:hypothetical protein
MVVVRAVPDFAGVVFPAGLAGAGVVGAGVVVRRVAIVGLRA